MLKYFQPVFDILKLTPTPSTTAVEELERAQRKLGHQLPEAFREWYSLEGTFNLLERDGRWHHPIEAHDLGNTPYDSQSVLVFMWENEAVYCWGICLDGTEDPPVVRRLNEPDTTWELYADHFSTFILMYLFDNTPMQWREDPFTPFTRARLDLSKWYDSNSTPSDRVDEVRYWYERRRRWYEVKPTS